VDITTEFSFGFSFLAKISSAVTERSRNTRSGSSTIATNSNTSTFSTYASGFIILVSTTIFVFGTSITSISRIFFVMADIISAFNSAVVFSEAIAVFRASRTQTTKFNTSIGGIGACVSSTTERSFVFRIRGTTATVGNCGVTSIEEGERWASNVVLQCSCAVYVSREAFASSISRCQIS
jgi:hypothetical protein